MAREQFESALDSGRKKTSSISLPWWIIVVGMLRKAVACGRLDGWYAHSGDRRQLLVKSYIQTGCIDPQIMCVC